MSSILSFDIGTSGMKTCLYTMDGARLILKEQAYASYPLYFPGGGAAEQDPNDWWEALSACTRSIAERAPELMKTVEGISFCSQMQSLVLLDKDAQPVRRAMSYMDQRAGKIRAKYSGAGPKIAGTGIPLLLKSLHHTGVVAASDKDPVWKYLWVKEHEPHSFARIHKWLDVKEALIAKLTGNFVMSEDSAFATLLLSKDHKNPAFSQEMLKALSIDPQHLPQIVRSTDEAGLVLPEIARELGLPENVRVFSGGGDASLVGVGAGCTKPGESHIYMGTSGWLSAVTDKQLVDTSAMIASVVGVQSGLYNYFAELETAGKCLEWVRDHLALDEINIYLDKKNVADDPQSTYQNLYEYLSEVIATAEAGSGGVIFTPWLHGNRCPFEDPNARGMFFNISLETGKTEMLRSVIEGICYHFRWFLEVLEKKLPIKGAIRFAGGGALSPVTASILADVIGRPIEVMKDPQNAGALGAAMVAAVGLGKIRDIPSAAELAEVDFTAEPNPQTKEVHERNYGAYRKLYEANKQIFKDLNI